MNIGVIGGGQLGMMIAQANIEKSMGHAITVLDPTNIAPAMKYAQNQVNGALGDFDSIIELTNSDPEILTIEVEHTNPDAMQVLEKAGYTFFPNSHTVRTIQDKFLQYEHLLSLSLPVPQTHNITSKEDLEELLNNGEHNYMLKQRVGSYDGKGNYHIRNKANIEATLTHFGDKPFMAQTFVPFEKELSVIVARDINGDIAAYDCAENEHVGSVLDISIVPARVDQSISNLATKIATDAVNSFEDVGIFAVEMFYNSKSDTPISINEIAPRVHNSGHWTMDGTSMTSQFEQHLRAITGEGLGPTSRTSPVVMFNILGQKKYDGMLNVDLPETSLKVFTHMYGKESKPGRKIGHVNVVGNMGMSVDEVLKVAEMIKANIVFTPLKNG